MAELEIIKSDVIRARERLLTIEETLNKIIVGHDEMIRAILVALVAGEHVVIIGPPGSAKSFAVHTLARLLNARFYRYLLTKFTDYSELFGPVDVVKLAQGIYERRWSAIVDADIVFLDEIFKANSAILNALLSMLQERVVYDSMTGEVKHVNLWTAVGASNEVPVDDELQALYDRFSVRVFIDYLSDDIALLNALEMKWLSQQNNGIRPEPLASMDDVKTLHHHAVALIASQIKHLGDPLYKIYHTKVIPLIKMMRSRGILVSDRTVIEKLPKLLASYLAIYGLTIDNILLAPIEIIQWMARDRSQLHDIQKVIDDTFGPVSELYRKLEEAKKSMKYHNYTRALRLLDEILTYDVSKMTRTPWLKPLAETIVEIARSYRQKIKTLVTENGSRR